MHVKLHGYLSNSHRAAFGKRTSIHDHEMHLRALQDFHQNPLADHAEKEVRPIMTEALRYINKGEKQSLLKITTVILSGFNALPISTHN